MVVRLSTSHADCHYLQEDSRYSLLLKAIVWLEGLGQLKNPMTSSGMKPVIFWLVA
jgi:hypothetical protein